MDSVYRYLMVVILAVVVSKTTFSQTIYAGLKGGLNLSWVSHNTSGYNDFQGYKDNYKILPVLGYNAGAVVAFKVKKRFFLHTEYLFSTKGKYVKGNIDKYHEDRVRYNFFEIPILYNIFFEAKLKTKRVRQFKWYAGIGPNFSYWLGGKGSIYSSEHVENNQPITNYKIRFGERGPNRDEIDVVYIKDARRIQLGVNIGGGILLEPTNGRKIMVDLRFELGHTWMGNGESADYLIPVDYKGGQNLKDRNMGLRLSLLYLFESNLDKKVRNKGKSTHKQRL
jgi:hypothetical protein